MVTIRFKFLTVILAVLALFLAVDYASAFTYTRTPSGATSEEPVSVEFQVSEAEAINGNYTTETHACLYGYNSTTATGYYSEPIPVVFDTLISVPNAFTVEGVYKQVSWYGAPNSSTCTPSTDFYITLEFAGGDDLFVITAPAPSQNSTWGTDNGFWGEDITAEVVGDELVASVQATGANIWGLFVFLGVALAFLLALYLVFFTKKTVSDKKEFDEVAFNKKADELSEFYSKTGGASEEIVEQIKKRGRGRPRKEII